MAVMVEVMADTAAMAAMDVELAVMAAMAVMDEALAVMVAMEAMAVTDVESAVTDMVDEDTMVKFE